MPLFPYAGDTATLSSGRTLGALSPAARPTASPLAPSVGSALPPAVGSALPPAVGSPLASGGGSEIALPAALEIVGESHFDYAASAPCVRAAAEAVTTLLPGYGSVHRGTGLRSQLSTLAYERARATVAWFAGARPGDHVIFTRNTTDALNLLARALPAGTTTVVFDGEHHANLLPWQSVVRLPLPATPAAAVESLAAALRPLTGPILVAVTGASNVTGELWPVADLAAVAHAHGARIVVDAAQLAPHAPVSLAALDADYLAFSGHKLYAPFGAGALVGRADWLDAADPYLRGGGASATVPPATLPAGPASAAADSTSVDSVADDAGSAAAGVERSDLAAADSADIDPTNAGSAVAGGRSGHLAQAQPVAAGWNSGPARHEGGTPNLLGAVALAAVCEALVTADRAALHAHEQWLLARLRDGLQAIPGAVDVSIFGADHPRVGIVSLALPDHDPARVAVRLAEEHGVGVRAGQFCAHPLTRHLTGDLATAACGGAAAPSLLRLSFGLGTTAADIDHLLAALAAVLA